jgi:hypothetical protein
MQPAEAGLQNWSAVGLSLQYHPITFTSAKMTQAGISSANQVEKRRRPTCEQIVAGIVVTFLVSTTLWCITPWIAPEVIGWLTTSVPQYRNANLVYSGYRVYGSSDWQLKTSIFWTSDSLDVVRQHYERYFRPFEERRIRAEAGNELHYWGSGSEILGIGTGVKLIDAQHPKRSTFLLFGYDDDPYTVLNSLPEYGTVIIVTDNIYAP